MIFFFFCTHFLAYSLTRQEHEGGLYVCMNTFLGFSRKYALLHYNKTGNALYLHIATTAHKARRVWLVAILSVL